MEGTNLVKSLIIGKCDFVFLFNIVICIFIFLCFLIGKEYNKKNIKFVDL